MSLALLSNDDRDLIAAFAGCSLDMEPGSNWVQDVGGLPDYICRIARAILRGGKKTSVSQAIAIAVSRVKVWASGKGVNKDTQAKAAAAVADWEAKRAKSKAKTAAMDTKKMAASYTNALDVLALTDYPVQLVVDAFNDRTRQARDAWRKAHPGANYDDPSYPQPMWVKEQWNSFLVVQSDYGRNPDLYKIPYTVDDDNNVAFGEPVEVKQQYVEITDADDSGSDITDEQLQQMMAASGPCPRSAAERFLTLTPRASALERVLALAGTDYANTKAKNYADPGYQADNKKRYALDTAGQVSAAWSYINQEDNAAKYSADDLAKVKARIKAAAKKFNIDIAAGAD